MRQFDNAGLDAKNLVQSNSQQKIGEKNETDNDFKRAGK